MYGEVEGSGRWLGAADSKAAAVAQVVDLLDGDVYGACRDEDWTESYVVRESPHRGEFIIVMKHQRGWVKHEHYAAVRRLDVIHVENQPDTNEVAFTVHDPVDHDEFTFPESNVIGMPSQVAFPATVKD